MPGFFGTPVAPTYTGPTAQDAIGNILAGQQQAFAQKARKLQDLQQGRFWDDETASQFGQPAPQGAPTDAGSSLPPDDAGATTGLLKTRTQAPAAPAVAAAGDVTGSPSTAAGLPVSPVSLSTGGRRPVAGEMLPAAGRFATTVDGKMHDQAQAMAAAGVAPTGLLATRASQPSAPITGPSVGAAAQQMGTPGAYRMPPVSVTGTRSQAAAPAAAAATPAPTSALQSPQSPPIDASRLMLSPADAAAMSPDVPGFLAQQGVPLSARLKGGGGVSYAVPMLEPAYNARAAALRSIAEQNAQTGRTVLTEQGANARSGNEIQGRHQDVATEQAGALEREQIEAAARAKQYEIEGKRLDAMLQQQTNMNNMHAGTEFVNAIKPVDQAVDQYRNFAAAMDQLRGTPKGQKPNPDALRAVGTAFAALTEGSPRISKFILAQGAKGPDLSWLGGGANAIQRGLSGSFTTETMNNMERAARAAAQEKVDGYNQQRETIGKFLPKSAQGLLPAAGEHYADVIDRMAPKESDYDRTPAGYKQFQADKAQWQAKIQ